jgi:uncharacterized protein (TIGR00251 family)
MVVYQVKVTPQSRESVVEELANNRLKVFLTAPAREGKANKVLITLLSKYFGVPKSAVMILSGVTNRNKKIGIRHA